MKAKQAQNLLPRRNSLHNTKKKYLTTVFKKSTLFINYELKYFNDNEIVYLSSQILNYAQNISVKFYLVTSVKSHNRTAVAENDKILFDQRDSNYQRWSRKNVLPSFSHSSPFG